MIVLILDWLKLQHEYIYDQSKCLFQNYSTVTDCFKTNSPNSKSGEFKILKQFNISFKLVVKSSSLTSLHHYNNKQQQLYVTIKHLKEVKGCGYWRISQVLCEKGFTTVRSNIPILNNYVHSIYKYVKQENKELIEVKSQQLRIWCVRGFLATLGK